MGIDTKKRLKLALLISGLLLCFAVLPVWSYGYYVLVRLIVFGSSVYVAIHFKNDSQKKGHFISLVCLAILFNPVAPVYLTRAIWLFIDLGVAVYFLMLSKKI